MAELLGLGHCVLPDPGPRQQLAHGARQVGRLHQVQHGDAQVAVVQAHARERHRRHAASIEVIEVGVAHGLAELERTVAAEVEHDDAVAIVHRPDRAHRPTRRR